MEPSSPTSILIIGSGVFGLSTAWALTRRPAFASCMITVVDDVRGGSFPPSDSASSDNSRIIRGDYADAAYTRLGAESQREWRKQGDDDLGGQGRYTESGLVVMAHEAQKAQTGVKSGMDYAKDSWRNVAARCLEDGYPASMIRTFDDTDSINAALGTDGRPGDWGYLNALSGWADAAASMAWLYRRVEATGGVRFVDAHVQQLETEQDRVVGARLTTGSVLRADIVLVAAGAWTVELIDLRGRVEATGHVLGYVDITEEEQAVLEKQPVVLNLTKGLFVIPPRARTLKLARHGFGYFNPGRISHALPPAPSLPITPITASRPITARNAGPDRLPAEADTDLRRALHTLIPLKGLEDRPWKRTKLCWYADTADGDWLVDWHPGWKGLFVATGDSGHAFKFLPVVGEKVVDCLLGQGGELGRQWRWKEEVEDGVGREVDGVFVGLTTKDGSRGGRLGMFLEEELRKS